MTVANRWLVSLLFHAAVISPVPAGAAAAAVQEIAEGVFGRPGRAAPLFEADNVANLGFVVGSRCVAVIDTGGSLAEGRALEAAISQQTDLPVCFVINTHVHPDHILGNKAFERENVQFIGHRKLPAAMASRGDVWLQRAAEASREPVDASHIVVPERTVGGEVQLDLGRRMLTVRAHATAHTDNDVSVLDAQTGTLFLGDLGFLEHLPVLDGSINGWLDELRKLMLEEYERVVPGHGPAQAAWPRAGEPTADYLRDLREKTRAWIAGGGELGAAQQAIEAARPEYWQLVEQYHKRNVATAFAELEWED
jgi:quinoprotein relay system zinc metallohydrolase 2